MLSHDLYDFIEQATKEIEKEYIRIQKRVGEDPSTAGDQGEENWKCLLSQWFPTFKIVTKGRILSDTGIASPQIDVLILQPEYPEHLLNKKLYLAGGVVAAFECKITLKPKHIEEFILNSMEIKRHIRFDKGTPYRELQSPILYGLLAHSHSWKKEKSNPVNTISNALLKMDAKYIKCPIQMPDILCVADLGYWNSVKMIYQSFKQNDKKRISSTYYLCNVIPANREMNLFNPIGGLITWLMYKLSWRYFNLRSLVSYFSIALDTGLGFSEGRDWDNSIFSDEVKNELEKVVLVQKDYDEWSMVIE